MSVTNLEILLIRHGQTASNASGIVQGHLPVPLNELGHRQAQRVADRLARWPVRIGRLISSDLVRATQTADPIARAIGLEPILDPAWREKCFGELQGQNVGVMRTWTLASDDEVTPPRGESRREFISRIHDALLRVQPTADGSPVAIVTHGGCCRVVLNLMRERVLPVAEDHPPIENVLIANCSIMALHRRDGLWSVSCVNDVAHLAPDEITGKDVHGADKNR